MTVLILRIAIFVAIGLVILFAARRIWRDWKGQFRAEDQAKLDRDREERNRMRQSQSGMINLKRDKDGKYRPEE